MALEIVRRGNGTDGVAVDRQAGSRPDDRRASDAPRVVDGGSRESVEGYSGDESAGIDRSLQNLGRLDR